MHYASRILTSAVLLFTLALEARAQAEIWIPPDIVVEPLSRASFTRVPFDEVEVGDAAAFASAQERLRRRDGGVRVEEIAFIRLTVKGDWWLSPADSVREKASLLGANFLLVEYRFRDERVPGAELHYRALRLERFDGLHAYVRPREAVDRSPRLATPPPADAPPPSPPLSAAPSPAPSAPRRDDRPREPLEWLWLDHDFIVSHRLGMDLSALSADAWADLDRVVRTHFSRTELAALRRLRREGASVVIDMRNRKLWPAS